MESDKCKCGKDGTEQINPFIKEINGEEVLEVLCDDCYYQACMDI